MITSIRIERPIDELHQDVYFFWFDDIRYRWELDEYIRYERETKRSKFKSIGYWRRTSQRDMTIKEKPLIPADVAAEVRAVFMSRITVEGEMIDPA